MSGPLILWSPQHVRRTGVPWHQTSRMPAAITSFPSTCMRNLRAMATRRAAVMAIDESTIATSEKRGWRAVSHVWRNFRFKRQPVAQVVSGKLRISFRQAKTLRPSTQVGKALRKGSGEPFAAAGSAKPIEADRMAPADGAAGSIDAEPRQSGYRHDVRGKLPLAFQRPSPGAMTNGSPPAVSVDRARTAVPCSGQRIRRTDARKRRRPLRRPCA